MYGIPHGRDHLAALVPAPLVKIRLRRNRKSSLSNTKLIRGSSHRSRHLLEKTPIYLHVDFRRFRPESFATPMDEPRPHLLSVFFFGVQYFIKKVTCLGVFLVDKRDDSAVAQYGDELVRQISFNH